MSGAALEPKTEKPSERDSGGGAVSPLSILTAVAAVLALSSLNAGRVERCCFCCCCCFPCRILWLRFKGEGESE